MNNKELKDLQQKRQKLLSLLKENEQALALLNEGDTTNPLPKKIDADLIEHIHQLDEKRNRIIKSDISFSGFEELDKTTGGFKKNDFVIIGARPGMGKSTLMLNILLNDIFESNKNVLYFSLEMTKKQILNKLLSYETGIAYAKINNGALKKSEWETLEENSERLRNSPLFIDDTPAINLYDLIAKCKQMKQQHNVSLVYVDSLQKITLTEKQKRQAKSRNVLNIVSSEFKKLIKSDDITIIATSQIAKSVETRGGAKRPQIYDLKGSTELEEDADIILLLYRPEYYRITQDEDGLDVRRMAELIVAKNKFGQTDTVKVKYNALMDKFEEFTPDDIEEYNRYNNPWSGPFLSEFDDEFNDEFGDDDDDCPF